MAPSARPLARSSDLTEIVAVEEIVAQHQRSRLRPVRKPVSAGDVKCLGESVRARLFGVGERETESGAIAQQPAEIAAGPAALK